MPTTPRTSSSWSIRSQLRDSVVGRTPFVWYSSHIEDKMGWGKSCKARRCLGIKTGEMTRVAEVVQEAGGGQISDKRWVKVLTCRYCFEGL